MSYLDVPRLTFFGQFTANPSTNNNNPPNYNTAAPMDTSGSWNPVGRHNFSLNNCQVTSITTEKGQTLRGQGKDTIVNATVSSTGSAVLVDLDTQQQSVSQIFGLNVVIAISDTASIQGLMRPVNFFDIGFGRLQGAVGDSGASASYMSVLEHVQWTGDVGPFATALKGATSGNMLSIHFVVDGYQTGQNPISRTGRVVGTIGPYLAGEPTSFVNARMLRPVNNPSPTTPDLPPPSGTGITFNMVAAKTDKTRKKMTFDFGNCMATVLNGTTITLQQYDPPLEVAFQQPDGTIAVLGTIDVSDDAYANTALVQEFDISKYATALASAPTFVQQSAGRSAFPFLAENPSGAYVNVDQYVFRLPGPSNSVTLYANIFELPATNQTVQLALNQALQGNAMPGLPVGTPASAISFPPSVTTGADGTAAFTLTSSNPGNPRGYIDGQVYSIGFNWALDTNPDPNAFISVHVYDSVPIPPNPTWWQDVYPILNQYSQLYPAMQAIIQLNNYNSLQQSIGAVLTRLNLPFDDPGLMPITRELSPDKLAIIQKWAANGMPQGTQPGAGS